MRRRPIALLAAAAIGVAWIPSALGAPRHGGHAAQPAATASGRLQRDAKRSCVYVGSHVSELASFGMLVDRSVDCALIFDSEASTWLAWEHPWFADAKAPADINWAAWKQASDRRLLVLTHHLVPTGLVGTNWLAAGAAGKFTAHARNLAQSLVAAGLGSSVIRMATEANGDWEYDSVGKSARDARRWRQFWRLTVLAMRSVPGAHFTFDWCVNAMVTRVPLSAFYPGDDVVDVVGVDAYDVAVPRARHGWQTVYARHMGVRDVLTFAKRHHKPLSLPEWGVLRTGGVDRGGGDDAGYVNGIASVVRHNAVTYQAYFYGYGWAEQLRRGRASLAAYRRHFGAHGDALGQP